MRPDRPRPPCLPLSALAALACGLCAFASRPAAAAPATALLDSTKAAGAADCPDAGKLARIVNDGLGRAAVAPAGPGAPSAPLRVGVTFERAARGYAATVEIAGAHGGTRRLSNGGPGCGALANAVGVLLVVVLDSDADADGASARSDRSGAASTRSPSAAPTAALARTNADVGFGGGVAEGLVGGWSPTLGVGGTVAYDRWAARLNALWLPSKTSDTGPGRVAVGLAAARLALCVRTGADRARLSLGLCAQQQLGWMRGRGYDFEAGDRTADHLWLAAGVAIVASGALERAFGWELEAGAVRLLREQRFVVDNFGTAFQSDPFAFMTTLSFTTRIW